VASETNVGLIFKASRLCSSARYVISQLEISRSGRTNICVTFVDARGISDPIDGPNSIDWIVGAAWKPNAEGFLLTIRSRGGKDASKLDDALARLNRCWVEGLFSGRKPNEGWSGKGPALVMPTLEPEVSTR